MDDLSLLDSSDSENSFFEALDDSVLLGELELAKLVPATDDLNTPTFDSFRDITPKATYKRSPLESPPGEGSKNSSFRGESSKVSKMIGESSGSAPFFGKETSVTPRPEDIAARENFDCSSRIFSESRVNDWIFGKESESFQRRQESLKYSKYKYKSEEFAKPKIQYSSVHSTSERPRLSFRHKASSASEPLYVPLAFEEKQSLQCNSSISTRSPPRDTEKSILSGKSHKLPSLPYKNYADYLKGQLTSSDRPEAKPRSNPSSDLAKRSTSTDIPEQPERSESKFEKHHSPFPLVHRPIVLPGNTLDLIGFEKGRLICSAEPPMLVTSHITGAHKQHQASNILFSHSLLNPKHLQTKDTNGRESSRKHWNNSDSSTDTSDELPSSERILTDSLIMHLDQDSSYCWERKMLSGGYSSLSLSSYLSKQKSLGSLNPELTTSADTPPTEQEIPSLVNSSPRPKTPANSVQTDSRPRHCTTQHSELFLTGSYERNQGALERCALLLEQINQKLLHNNLRPQSPSKSLDSLLIQIQVIQEILQSQKAEETTKTCTTSSSKCMPSNLGASDSKNTRVKRLSKRHLSLSLISNRKFYRTSKKILTLKHSLAQIISLKAQNQLLSSKLLAFQEYATLRSQAPQAFNSRHATSYLILRDKLIYSILRN